MSSTDYLFWLGVLIAELGIIFGIAKLLYKKGEAGAIALIIYGLICVTLFPVASVFGLFIVGEARFFNKLLLIIPITPYVGLAYLAASYRKLHPKHRHHHIYK